jgi:hypothetical protein
MQLANKTQSLRQTRFYRQSTTRLQIDARMNIRYDDNRLLTVSKLAYDVYRKGGWTPHLLYTDNQYNTSYS